MRNIIFLTLAGLTLTGCSELNIVTKAAFKEMNCEIVNLEQDRFTRRNDAPTPVRVVAQATAETPRQ